MTPKEILMSLAMQQGGSGGGGGGYPEPTGTKQISIGANGTTTENVKDFASAAITVDVPTYPEPTGIKIINITQNGATAENIKDYASAQINVNVPEPTGTKNITITSNGTTSESVSDYANAEISVDVPQYREVITGAGFIIEDDTIDKIRSRAFSMFDNYDTCKLTLPNCLGVGTYAFENSMFGSLSLSLPICTEVANGAFSNCQAQVQTELLLPSLTASLAYGNFNGCSAFHTIDIGPGLTYIGNNVFKDVTGDVILRRTASKVTLGNASAFNGFSGHIYVPDAMVSDYQAATNWSDYASLILPISDYVAP